MDLYRTLVCFLNIFLVVNCGYPPTGDEVLPGSVLLPASRRGRYLANIVRRQAVDGTGIKFNKNADRMNAEAKKKVDVLSDELLPYIIAEQERRLTLYKRVMCAIQNGEKGVTIVEIRNKSPLIVKRGSKYRCPRGRQPKEPDGSGALMCEGDIPPTMIMYDSCVDAEDKPLFEADKKFFFCNRHRQEGADPPRTVNGTAVGPCAPSERTPFNYTQTKCALEDTEDVVVHYRYYPDKSYKFVVELDPDHEVCDHWNPCQIGYIFSLASPQQASIATDTFAIDSEKDFKREFVHPNSKNYRSSRRRVAFPKDGKPARRSAGYEFKGVRARRTIDGQEWKLSDYDVNVETEVIEDEWVMILIEFPDSWSREVYYSHYYAIFAPPGGGNVKSVRFLTIEESTVQVQLRTVMIDPVQLASGPLRQTAEIRCSKCQLQALMIRNAHGYVSNVRREDYFIRDRDNGRRILNISLEGARPETLGEIFAVIQNEDGNIEKVQVLSLPYIKVTPTLKELKVGEKFDATVKYECNDCTLKEVIHNGQRFEGAVIQAQTKTAMLSWPSFADELSGAYIGKFEENGKIFLAELVVLETVTVTRKSVVPKYGQRLEETIPFKCNGCTLQEVRLNGIKIATTSIGRRYMPHYYEADRSPQVLVGPDYVVVVFPYVTLLYLGPLIAVFGTEPPVSKILMWIGSESAPAGFDNKSQDTSPSTTSGDNDASASTPESSNVTEASTPDPAAEPSADPAADPSADPSAEPSGDASEPAPESTPEAKV